MTGTLFVVATPIGNLEDITLRALRVLREVTLIAAEDTRRTAKLLSHYAIATPTTSLHEHNERQKLPSLLARLQAGHSIAAVTDAGMPGISDPGYRLICAAIDRGIRVEVIPGPSAVLTALVASGLPTDAFTFVGFPPSRSIARKKWLKDLAGECRTLVFFEAPHRIRETLQDAHAILGDRPISVARELTKVHETLVRGPISDVLHRLDPMRGEVTVVIGPPAQPRPVDRRVPSDRELLQAFEDRPASGARTRREQLAAVARQYGMSIKEVYAAIERAKKLV